VPNVVATFPPSLVIIPHHSPSPDSLPSSSDTFSHSLSLTPDKKGAAQKTRFWESIRQKCKATSFRNQASGMGIHEQIDRREVRVTEFRHVFPQLPRKRKMTSRWVLPPVLVPAISYLLTTSSSVPSSRGAKAIRTDVEDGTTEDEDDSECSTSIAHLSLARCNVGRAEDVRSDDVAEQPDSEESLQDSSHSCRIHLHQFWILKEDKGRGGDGPAETICEIGDLHTTVSERGEEGGRRDVRDFDTQEPRNTYNPNLISSPLTFTPSSAQLTNQESKQSLQPLTISPSQREMS
jgi:hypothetical protein